MPRLTKIYTRTGDEGLTSLGGGQRVPKNHPRVTAYGTIDELNSVIGLSLAHGLSKKLTNYLVSVQNDLFNIGTQLCFINEDLEKYELPTIADHQIHQLENWIDELNEVTGSLKNFILPGGNPAAATLHIARTVCRRAEREVCSLSEQEKVDPILLAYLNRLSDVLFMMARFENIQNKIPETLWDSHA